MNMKLLLLNPVNNMNVAHIRVGRCQTHGQPGISCWPPIDLALIGSVIKAKNNGVDVCLYDSQLDNNYENMISYIKEVLPDVVIINATTPTVNSDIKLSEKIKMHNKKTIIIFYGLHVSIQYDEVLKSGMVDFCVIGEPEKTISNLITKLRQTSNKDEFRYGISNIAFLSRENEVVATHRDYAIDDNLIEQHPDRSLLKNEQYKLQYNNEPFSIIQVSRGCPYECIFCTSSIYSHKYQLRSVDSVISEIYECITKHDIRNFMFLSDTFTLNKQWVNELCKRIIECDMKIKWISNSRVDTIDYQTAHLMKKAGCWLISLGIESANDEILCTSKKGINSGQISNAIEIFRSLNMRIIGYFIIGLPGETKNSIKETICYAKKSKIDYAYFFFATPFPGTELFRMAQNKGWLLTEDWDKYSHGEELVMNCTELSEIELYRLLRNAYRQFYLRPSKIIEQIKTINSFEILLHNIRAAVSILKK